MLRSPNTTVQGNKFEKININFVWLKATTIPGCNPEIFRKDIFGAWIKKSQFGKVDSQYGWEIDHIKPVEKKGLDYLDNLQPLHWKNNRLKGDNYPNCNIEINREEQITNLYTS